MIHKRLLSILLAVSLCVSLLSTPAAAAQVRSQLQLQGTSSAPLTVSGTEAADGKRLTLSAPEAQHLIRDYDQTLLVEVTSHSSVSQEYYLVCDNPYGDLSMNFVMCGSKDAPLIIQPGETQTVELSVFAQNAEQTSYTVPIRSVVISADEETEDAGLALTFTCDPGDGVVSIVPTGEPDPDTLARTYTITNVGESDIADLGLTIRGDAADYLRIDPMVENYPLAAGASVSVDLVPDLAKMKRDGQAVLTGSIVPTGGVARVEQGGSAQARTLSAPSAPARSGDSGAAFSLNANLNEIKTISASDLALYQEGNPFYDVEYVEDGFRITSSASGREVDLGDLTAQYWDPDDPDKNGVDTEEEFQAVLNQIVAPSTQTYDYTMHSVLRYTGEDGQKSDVRVSVRMATEMKSEAPSSWDLETKYYYDADKDELRIETISYSDAAEYQEMMAQAAAHAAEEMGISPGISARAARLNAGDWAATAWTTVTTISDAGLGVLTDLSDYTTQTGYIDTSTIQTPADIEKFVNGMNRVDKLADAARPAQGVLKGLNTAANFSEAAVDFSKTADVWNAPNISWEQKAQYGGLMMLKTMNNFYLSGALVEAGTVLGAAIGDGVGAVFGFAAGAAASVYIQMLIEQNVNLYDALFALLRFRALGLQCTNRGILESKFTLPEIKSTSSSGEDEGISGSLEDAGLYATSRIYNGKPAALGYADSQFGGNTYQHYRDIESRYKLNGKNLGVVKEHGLSEVAIADLSGPEATEALQNGENTLVRDYLTDPGHYTVETDTTITVAPGADFEMGYAGSVSGLPDVRQLPDFAVYHENILPEHTVIIGEENTLNISVYNLGSAGGWVNVTVNDQGTAIHTEKNLHIDAFSSAVIPVTWTPTAEENTVTVTVERPAVSEDGCTHLDTDEYQTDNNTASAVFAARHRVVPQITEMSDRILYTDTAHFLTEIADACDVKSVTVQIGEKSYSSDLQLRSSSGNQSIRASAPLSGLGDGKYDATVTVTYYTTENGTTGINTLTENVTVTLRQYGQIVCYVDIRQPNITSAMVLRPNSAGELDWAPTATVSRAMGTFPSKCTIKYDPDVLTSIDDCIFVVRYSGTPGGLVVVPLEELAGRTLSVTGEGYTKVTVETTENESFAFNYLTKINGIPMADPEEIQLPADSGGNIYFCGADSIEINSQVTLQSPSIRAYTKITFSREAGTTYRLSDYYSAFSLPVSDDLTGGSIQRIDTLLTGADGNVRTGSGAYWNYSGGHLAVFLPFSTAAYTSVRAAIFYNNSYTKVAYYDVDLLSAQALSDTDCRKISLRLPNGEMPWSASVTTTKQGIGKALTASCCDLFLSPGVYDLAIQYHPVKEGEALSYTTQVAVTDTAAQTITLPLSAAQATLARSARSGGQTAELSWPAMFSSAVFSTRSGEDWSSGTAVENGASVQFPEDAVQLRLHLTGPSRTAAVLCPIPTADKLAIGDVFAGTATAGRDSYTAGDNVTLQLSGLTDAGGAQLTAYQAAADAAAMTGTLVLTGGGREYRVPVTMTDLTAGVKAVLPSDIPEGRYDYTISLLTELMVDEPEEGGSQGSGSGGSSSGSSSSQYPNISVDGIGGTATAENGTVTILPDEGYAVGSVTINGAPAEIPQDGKLTGCRRTDKVVVTFVKLWDNPFQDVPADAWYCEAVRYAWEHHIMQGTSSAAFSPSSTTTRAMIVTMLYRLEGEPSAAAADFTDVAATDYYASAVGWAQANAIVTGVSDTAFAPDSAVTREQIAVILYRYASFKGYDVSAIESLTDRFTDAEAVSTYAKTAMQWAVGSGLIQGDTGAALRPRSSATRAEVAAILMRFCETILP